MAIPTVEPAEIIAGDTLEWTKSIQDYTPADGWVLSYILLSSGKTPISITASGSGTTHSVSVDAATTAAYVAATYHWTSMVTRAATSERKTISSNVVSVIVNPSTQTSAYDPRTHEEKCLAAIEAVIEGRMADPIVEYQIGNRMAKKIPHKELVELRSYYAAQVRIQQGGPRAIAIPVRFRNV